MKTTETSALVVRWRELAEILKAEGCIEVAAARERCATELESLLHTQQNEPLSIDRAASESGYSAEYLRRLLRQKPELNAGRAGKPLIHRRNLPRKANALVRDGRDVYDVCADARFLCESATRNSQ